MGSALFEFYKNGTLRSEGNSITEGIGQGRITANLVGAPIDLAYQVSDEDALPIVFDLAQHEGLLLGGSSGINVAGAMRLARDLGAWSYDRDDPLRLGHTLSIQVVQSVLSARKELARTGLAEPAASHRSGLRMTWRKRGPASRSWRNL